jgi:plasmid stabilization system protein ParE
MKPIRYLDIARQEYENQIRFLIQNRSVAHALRFKEEVEKAEAEIQRKPDAFKIIGSYRSYGPTRKEKYRISYVETTSEIIIVAVYYSGVCDPLYWLGRPAPGQS